MNKKEIILNKHNQHEKGSREGRAVWDWCWVGLVGRTQPWEAGEDPAGPGWGQWGALMSPGSRKSIPSFWPGKGKCKKSLSLCSTWIKLWRKKKAGDSKGTWHPPVSWLHSLTHNLLCALHTLRAAFIEENSTCGHPKWSPPQGQLEIFLPIAL